VINNGTINGRYIYDDGLTIDATLYMLSSQDLSPTGSPTFETATVTDNVTVDGLINGINVTADGILLDEIESWILSYEWTWNNTTITDSLFMGGNITFEDGGTFGGRDLSVDGEKLDEIAPFVNQDVTYDASPSFANINSTIGIYHDCLYPGDPFYLWCYPAKTIDDWEYYEEGAYHGKILMYPNNTEWPQQSDYPLQYPFANYVRVGAEITFWTCVQWDTYHTYGEPSYVTVTIPGKYVPSTDYYPMTFSYSWGLNYNFEGPGYTLAAMGIRSMDQVSIGSVYKNDGMYYPWTGSWNGMQGSGMFCISGTYFTFVGYGASEPKPTKTTPFWLEPEYLEKANRLRDERRAKLKAEGWQPPVQNPDRPKHRRTVDAQRRSATSR